MTKLIEKFTPFMYGTLKFLIIIDIIAGIGLIAVSMEGFNESVLIFGFIAILASLLGYRFINIKMSLKYKLILILIIGFSLRVLWLLNVDTIPTSDFKTMYDSAGSFLSGDRSMFYKTAYLGRFPHLTIFTLYMAVIRYLFPISNILVMKVINLLLSIIVLFLIYLILKILYRNEDYALKGVLIGVIFPPFISYAGVFCSENIAIPLYLLSIYLFLIAIKHENKLWIFALSSITLAAGNLFRMVAIIVLIAYSIYILMYCNEKIVNKIKKIGVLLIPYVLIICFVSSLLQGLNITDHSLWKGSEPNITSVLKGTNYNSFGAWNLEDAKVIEDNINNYNNLKKLSKEIIKERLITTPIYKLGMFYLVKFALVWSSGDCGGVLWSQKDIDENSISSPVNTINIISAPISTIFQIIYVLALILVLIGLFNKDKLKTTKEINLFYLLLCGYGLTYLITEAQQRYSYIISWIFIILAVNGIDYLKIFRNSFVFYNDSL